MEEEEFELKRDLKTSEFSDDVMFVRSIYAWATSGLFWVIPGLLIHGGMSMARDISLKVVEESCKMQLRGIYILNSRSRLH